MKEGSLHTKALNYEEPQEGTPNTERGVKDLTLTKEDVEKAINTLKNKNSAGRDGIPAPTLKNTRSFQSILEKWSLPKYT